MNAPFIPGERTTERVRVVVFDQFVGFAIAMSGPRDPPHVNEIDVIEHRSA